MVKIIVRFFKDALMPGLEQNHVFHNEHDMKAWFNTCGFFQTVTYHDDDMGTFLEKGGVWRGHFNIEKAESHL